VEKKAYYEMEVAEKEDEKGDEKKKREKGPNQIVSNFNFVFRKLLQKSDKRKKFINKIIFLNMMSIERIDSILVVDDMDVFKVIQKRILNNYFPTYKVHLASNGKEAIDALSNKLDPSLIVSDYEMYPLNGIELYSWIHDNLNGKSKRFVFFTSFLDFKLECLIEKYHIPLMDKSQISLEDYIKTVGSVLGYEKNK